MTQPTYTVSDGSRNPFAERKQKYPRSESIQLKDTIDSSTNNLSYNRAVATEAGNPWDRNPSNSSERPVMGHGIQE